MLMLGNDIQYQRYSLCYTAFVSCQIKSINILFRVILQPTYTNKEKDYNCTCETWGGGGYAYKHFPKKTWIMIFYFENLKAKNLPTKWYSWDEGVTQWTAGVVIFFYLLIVAYVLQRSINISFVIKQRNFVQ